MEGGLTDYLGPRYRCSNDKPRGIDWCIRDAAGYPKTFRDTAPVLPESCTIEGVTLSCGGDTVTIDPGNGFVAKMAGRAVSLGTLKYNGEPFCVREIKTAGHRLCLSGLLPGFGDVILEYFINAGWLYGEISARSMDRRWDDTKIAWGDCVYIEHAKSSGAQVVRTVSGVTQPTGLERFHSLDVLEIREPGHTLTFRHGGNVFFRQTPVAVQNRLWCYDEFCDRFYWAVSLNG
jgi:hypothetical protein